MNRIDDISDEALLNEVGRRMVTIKCHAGRQALSKIVAPGKCQLNAITRAMVNCIHNFNLGCKAIAPIECFSIMPDNIHLLIRIVEQVGAKPDNATLYRRCHEMGDVILEVRNLGKSKALNSATTKSFTPKEGNDE